MPSAILLNIVRVIRKGSGNIDKFTVVVRGREVREFNKNQHEICELSLIAVI